MKPERLTLTLLLAAILGLTVLFAAGLYLGLRTAQQMEQQMLQLQKAQGSLEVSVRRQQQSLDSSLEQQQLLRAALDRQQADQADLRRQVQALARCTACAELG